MAPGTALEGETYSGARNAELAREASHRFAVRHAGPNLRKRFVAQFGATVPFSARVPILADGVGHVICLGSEKEMIGSNAGAVVTLVKHKKPLWYRAVMDDPRRPMRQSVIAESTKLPVSVLNDGSEPRPTAVSAGLLNLVPEASLHRGHVLRHN